MKITLPRLLAASIATITLAITSVSLADNDAHLTVADFLEFAAAQGVTVVEHGGELISVDALPADRGEFNLGCEELDTSLYPWIESCTDPALPEWVKTCRGRRCPITAALPPIPDVKSLHVRSWGNNGREGPPSLTTGNSHFRP